MDRFQLQLTIVKQAERLRVIVVVPGKLEIEFNSFSTGLNLAENMGNLL